MSRVLASTFVLWICILHCRHASSSLWAGCLCQEHRVGIISRLLGISNIYYHLSFIGAGIYKIIMICLSLIWRKKKFRVKYLLPMAKAESNIFMNILHLYTHWQMYWYFVWIIEIACISCFNKKHQKDNNKNKNNTPPPQKNEKEKKKRLLSCSLSNRPCRIYIWCSAVFVSTPDFPVEMTKWFPSETHYFN